MKKIFNIQNIVPFLCLCICFLILCSDFGGGYDYQIFLTISLIMYVALFYISRKFLFKNYSRPKKYFIFMTSLLVFACIVFTGFDVFVDRPNYVAKTANVALAKKIGQNNIYTTIMFDAENDMYYVKYNSYNSHDIDNFKIGLALDYLYDDDVKILHKYYFLFGSKRPSNKRLEKFQEKYYIQLLKKFLGISDVKVDVKISEKETFVTIDAKYLGGYTEKEIKDIITKLIDEDSKVTINLKQKEEKIEDIWFRYTRRARFACKYDEYDDAIELLNDAKSKFPKEYEKRIQANIDDINKIIELNKRIKKQPNNYKLYVERGDLENEEPPKMFNFRVVANEEKAFADYKKALELNPKAYDLYENLGDIQYYAYKKGTSNPMVYYAKAITYDKTNSKVYRKMGNIFYRNHNYKKALEYYKKSLQYQKDKTKLEDGGIGYYRKEMYWFDIYRDIYLTQKRLKMYDDAMQTCYERLATTTNNPHEQKIKEEINKEIRKLYFWKPYHLKHITFYPARFSIFLILRPLLPL